jgi:hypothetical protein
MIYAFITVCLFLILSDIADTETSVKIQKELGYVESNPLYGKGTRPSRLKFYAISTPINAFIIGVSYLALYYLPHDVPLWALAPMAGAIKHCIPSWSSYKALKAAGKW